MILDLKLFYHTEGKLVRIPGLPDMYDYEFFPQKVWPIELLVTESTLNEFMNV